MKRKEERDRGRRKREGKRKRNNNRPTTQADEEGDRDDGEEGKRPSSPAIKNKYRKVKVVLET